MRRVAIAVLLLNVASANGAAPPAGEVAMVYDTLAAMYEAGAGIEKLRREKNALPKLGNIAELSKARFGNKAWEEGLVDAWGKPFHIESDPAKSFWLIVAAGSDRKFDRGTWNTSARTRSSAEDIVLRNGELVRSPLAWAAAEAGDELEQGKRALELSRHRRTVSDLRSIASAALAYATDHPKLPKVKTIDELATHLEPAYSRSLPRTDGWRTPLQVQLDAAANVYVITAAGPDRKFGSPDDVVIRDVEFVRNEQPSAAPPSAPEPDRDRAAATMATFAGLAEAVNRHREKNRWQDPKAATLDELTQILVPKYASRVPKTDGWGTPLQVRYEERELRVISAGSDRKFDPSRWNEVVSSADYTRDLRLVGTDVLGVWDTASAADRLAAARGRYVVSQREFEREGIKK